MASQKSSKSLIRFPIGFLIFVFCSSSLYCGVVTYGSSATNGASPCISVTDETYPSLVKENEAVMVLYYVNWCYWSNILMPEYEQAAKLMALHHSPVKFLTVDCTECRVTAAIEGIQRYPTMKLFINQQPHNYNGRRQRTDIVNWIDGLLDRDKHITSKKETDELFGGRSENHALVIAFIPPGYHSTTFVALSRKFGDSSLFGETADADIIGYIKEKYMIPYIEKSTVEKLSLPFAAMWLNLDGEEKLAVYQGSLESLDEMSEFVKQNSFPPIVKYDRFWSSKLYEDGRPVVVIVTDQHSDTKDIEECVRPVAIREKGFLFTILHNGELAEKRLIDQLAIEDESFPLMRIISFNERERSMSLPLLKYRPEEKFLNHENLETFLSAYLADKIPPYVKSEVIPDDDTANEPVKVFVGDTFERGVRQSPDDIFVLFHAPWCGHCRELLPAYNELGRRLQNVPHLVISKIDATRNEVRDVVIMGYPTLLLFPANSKHRPVSFTGPRTLEYMTRWLSQHTQAASFEPRKYLEVPFVNVMDEDEYDSMEEL